MILELLFYVNNFMKEIMETPALFSLKFNGKI